jgi:phosphoadenosine phosphosulfate reductase
MDMTPLDRHERIALSFSGGKDSLALAHLLEPHWDRLTFYHVDAGDLLPEVSEIVAQYEKRVPHFVRIKTNSRAWMQAFGMPSDLVPHTATAMGVQIGGELRLVERWDCCGQNLWMPMHNRMMEDKVTLVIRGTKRCDMKRLPFDGGPTEFYELWLPLIEWSHAQVFQYLRAVGAPIARVYEHAVNAPECATCPAWLDERRATYLKAHPDLLAEYSAKLHAVAHMVGPQVDRMKAELEALDGNR